MKTDLSLRKLKLLLLVVITTLYCTSKYNIVRLKNDTFAQSQLISLSTQLRSPAEPSRSGFGSNRRTLELQCVKEIKANAEVKNEIAFSFTHAESDADMAEKAFFAVDGKPF